MGEKLGYKVEAAKTSGLIDPGESLWFRIVNEATGSEDPQVAMNWYVSHNGVRLNHLELTALCEGQVLHTSQLPSFGFKLRPEVRGQIEVKGVGWGLYPTYTYTIVAVPIDEPTLSDVIARLDRIEQMVSGLVN